jgi:hypothetical protein
MHRARLPIAQPCHERFDAMAGGDVERFCERCSTPVHDLSQMTKVQAQHFLAERGGQRVCVRYRSDATGELQFRPTPPMRPSLVLAVASLALAACTGYVEADAIDSPEDATLCEDGSGYTIPCEDSTAAPPAPETIAEPEPVEGGVSPELPEVDVMGQVENVEMGEVEMGDIEVPRAEVDPEIAAEGCPVPRPDAGDSDLTMGRIVVEPTSRVERHRLERQWKREQRRQARRDRRSRGA